MKKIFNIVLGKIIGLMIFLIILAYLNSLTLNSVTLIVIRRFLNDNIVLMIAMSLFFMVAEIFFELMFPFNLPAPVVAAFASMILLKFLGVLFMLVQGLARISLFGLLSPILFLAYPVVFIAVIIGGYVSIFTKLHKPKEKVKAKKEKIRRKEEWKKSWEKVGDEFRQAFSDMFYSLGDAFKKR